MLDAVAAHVKLVHRHHIFGEVVRHGSVNAKFPLNRLFGSQQIAYLHIELFVLLLPDEINLPAADFTDGENWKARKSISKIPEKH